MRLLYRVVAPAAPGASWTIDTVGYEYRFRAWDGPSIVTYHWHPVGRSPILHPHLHVGGRTEPFDLSKAHLTTGPVTLPMVIRMAIAELGVEPRRADWDTVLARAERGLIA